MISDNTPFSKLRIIERCALPALDSQKCRICLPAGKREVLYLLDTYFLIAVWHHVLEVNKENFKHKDMMNKILLVVIMAIVSSFTVYGQEGNTTQSSKDGKKKANPVNKGINAQKTEQAP